MVTGKNISLYFKDLSAQQLMLSESLQSYKPLLKSSKVERDWQSVLCKEMGLNNLTIPYNQLRAMQLDIAKDMQTIVCCDPVMMQMTHRGAYLWGQQSLEFSEEDVMKIVAQINQQLMGEGERIYLLDNNQWLYCNKNRLELKQSSFENYIGKDMFGFAYARKDGMYWQKLATEIQMLIKQMMDYQGLTQAPPEMIVNVHFWGDSALKYDSQFEQVNDMNTQILCSDPQLKLFVKCSGLKVKALLNNNIDLNRKNILIMTGGELEPINPLIEHCLEQFKHNKIERIRLVTQDQILDLTKPKSLWQRIFKSRH